MRLDEEVSECLTGTPTDPSANVMQLRQPELVGVVHDQRVHVRHINPGLNDRRAYQHICLAPVETRHHMFQIVFMHLAMSDQEFGFWHQLPQPPMDAFNALDTVVQEECLPATIQLP